MILLEYRMANDAKTQLVVLGGGPGGYAAAFLAADKGIQTTLIDAAPKPGGICLHVGCIPSKALLHAAHVIHSAHDVAAFGIKFAPPQIDLNVLRAKKEKITDTMASHLLELCKRRGVTHIVGRGTLLDAHAIQVEKGPKITFDNCILATGSSPTKLPNLSLDSPRVLDSTSALQIENIPASLLVVGGGYIGLEMGSV